jgi:segregation and condensation protein B
MTKLETKETEIKEVEEKTTPKEGGVLADEAPRNIVFEEALEAILFAAGHPISYATLARVFNMTPAKVRDRVLEYSLQYNDSATPRGVILLVYNDSCQLSTKKYYLNEIRDALGIRKSGTLSSSSMEALAIVAYNQPVTRAFVDTLRRADSSYAMNNLLDRGLIESKGRLDAPGRPMLYGTTSDFLRCFGLKDLSALPQTTEEIQTMFANTSNVPDDEEEEEIRGGEQISIESSEAIANANETSTHEDHEPSADDHVSIDDEAESADEQPMIDSDPVDDEQFDYDEEPSADEQIDFDEVDAE